nr:ribosomal RNA small subunit methyltransferase nep-1-like [Arachis hypogaea]
MPRWLLLMLGRYQILNPNKHANFLRRKNKNPYDYRPDIVHEALLQIMGSRICMAGRVHGVFIKTDEGILIRVEPNTQIPKTLESFCNMMAELLQKFSIKSKGNRGKLLRLIENPVTQHLPINSRKIGLSVSSPKAVQINDYVATANHDENLVFVVGAMAHGKIQQQSLVPLSGVGYMNQATPLCSVMYHVFSALPLSAGTCLRRICVTLERNQKIH